MRSAAVVQGLHPSAPHPLPFAPELRVRAFVLPRETDNLMIYAAPTAAPDVPVSRQYLNHWHEAMFLGDGPAAPLHVHEADRGPVEERDGPVEATFAERTVLDGDFELIPTPGHTPGATAFLWDSGEWRYLFTGDSIYLHEGEWIGAVLESSDRAAYIESLELLREVEFDVLVPWAATSGEPYFASTTARDSRRRIDAIVARLRSGLNH